MLTRNCPKCERPIAYTTRNGYNVASRKRSLCLSCAISRYHSEAIRQRLNHVRPAVTELIIKEYQLLGMVTIETSQSIFVSLQVIQFTCPSCQTMITKRLHPDGWRLKASCQACGTPYNCEVLPVPENKSNES